MNDRRLQLNHNDLNFHATMSMTLHGNETSWIGSISGADPDNAVISLNCKQLGLIGHLPAIEAVVWDWNALLVAVRTDRAKWDDLPMRARRAGRVRPAGSPHPFARRPDGLPLPSAPFLGPDQ